MFPAVARLLAHDPRALGKAASAVEANDPAAMRFLSAAEPGVGLTLGVTGPPGAGKSSLVAALARVMRDAGKTVAIIAVDPTSRATGGALLGDRIRMTQHYADPGIFIRSTATRGSSGGLAHATGNLVRLLQAARFDYVVIETVGVGQDEVAVARLAEVTVVVLVPGLGDDVQAIKAGIMEIADVFAINKADHPGADAAEREIQNMLSLGPGRRPPIVQTVATEGKGIDDLLRAIETVPRHHQQVESARFEIDHVAIAVRSLEEALAFYREQLGMNAGAREIVEQEKVRVAMLETENGRLELLEAAEPDSTIAKFVEKRGEGIHHFALRVDDLAGIAGRLRERGARILNEPRQGAGGHYYVFVHPASTGGVLLELIQK